MQQNYHILISYDGTDYFGWQRQPEKKTIQGLIENALTKIASRPISVMGSGRTDAGVHALAQSAHFKAHVALNDCKHPEWKEQVKQTIKEFKERGLI